MKYLQWFMSATIKKWSCNVSHRIHWHACWCGFQQEMMAYFSILGPCKKCFFFCTRRDQKPSTAGRLRPGFGAKKIKLSGPQRAAAIVSFFVWLLLFSIFCLCYHWQLVNSFLCCISEIWECLSTPRAPASLLFLSSGPGPNLSKLLRPRKARKSRRRMRNRQKLLPVPAALIRKEKAK